MGLELGFRLGSSAERGRKETCTGNKKKTRPTPPISQPRARPPPLPSRPPGPRFWQIPTATKSRAFCTQMVKTARSDVGDVYSAQALVRPARPKTNRVKPPNIRLHTRNPPSSRSTPSPPHKSRKSFDGSADRATGEAVSPLLRAVR
jgi:hypothetical protein